MNHLKLNLNKEVNSKLATHYKGDVAKFYNKNRSSSLKWKREQKIMERIISNFSPNRTILDLPIGTGRLIPFYKLWNHKAYGIDISKDMLKEVSKLESSKDTIIDLIEGNVEKIPLPNNSVDYVICLRLFNLVGASTLEKGLKEFCRVSNNRIIFQVRVLENIGKIKLIFKLTSDLRTHFNRLIYPIFAWSKKILNSAQGKSNVNKFNQAPEKYYLHQKEKIFSILKDEGFNVVSIIEVDKGMDFSKGDYKPLLILEFEKNKYG
jgi:ubiquinone/menaquinone biosynthesis C-methylase UbiE